MNGPSTLQSWQVTSSCHFLYFATSSVELSAVAFDADEVVDEVLVPKLGIVLDEVFRWGFAVCNEVVGDLADRGGCGGHWILLL